MRQRRSGGFTLVEMLVVVAIIAILASIVFPVFSRARAAARKAACASNLRQIGTAFELYVSDNDECLPDAWSDCAAITSPPNLNAGRLLWPEAIQPYCKNTDLFTCPEVPRMTFGPPPAPNYDGGSYGMNAFGISLFGNFVGTFQDPAGTVLAMDSSRQAPTARNEGRTDGVAGLMPGFAWHDISVRHHKRSNVLFMDSHVKCMPKEVILEEDQSGHLRWWDSE
jgi:prepilin-type N-terminal cleavage/methylation domain-containing protein/prepilin-type processing-associated H-X9-DG protein